MSQYSTPRSRWAAVSSRDALASNAFIYCVTSTKIYCRPNCPSRLARRANIVFHDTPAQAEADGYRACMRCRPEMDEKEGDPQKVAVGKACELIRKEGEGQGEGKGKRGEKWGVKSLAREVGLTESHFCRVFKKVMGVTVGEYRSKTLEESSRRNVSLVDVVPSKAVPALDIFQKATSPVECQYVPDEFYTGDAFLDFDSELARDWHDFSGTPNLMNSLDMLPDLNGMDQTGFDFLPELVSDASTPTTIDDGLQFLNFDDPPLVGHLD